MQEVSSLEPPAQISPAPEQGLTSQQARLKQFGPNDPAPAHRRSGVADLLLMFVNPLVIILLIAAVLAGFLGQLVEAGIIIVVVLGGVAINFYQTFRSQLAVERLRDSVAATATELRGGERRGRRRRVAMA